MGETPRRGGDILWEKFDAVTVSDVPALLGELDVEGRCERAVWKEVVLGVDVDARIAIINESRREELYRYNNKRKTVQR